MTEEKVFFIINWYYQLVIRENEKMKILRQFVIILLISFRRTVKSCAAIACSGKRVGAYPYAGGIENRGAQAESGF